MLQAYQHVFPFLLSLTLKCVKVFWTTLYMIARHTKGLIQKLELQCSFGSPAINKILFSMFPLNLTVAALWWYTTFRSISLLFLLINSNRKLLSGQRFHRVCEKNMGFHLISKSHLWWKNHFGLEHYLYVWFPHQEKSKCPGVPSCKFY